MPTFFDDYQEYTKALEVPEIFHVWCACSAIAAAAQRKVWLDMELFKISPNLYIVLVSPPGIGKGTSMNVVRDLLGYIQEIHVKSDSITKEKIFSTLEKVSKPAPIPGTTKTLIHSSLTIFADEMSVFVKKGDQDFIGALNMMYNTMSVFRYSTKNMGENVIVNPYVNILCGTTPDWIAKNMQEDLLEGGFSARTIFVFSETNKHVNPRLYVTEEGKAGFKRIISRLEQISQRIGQFKMTDEGRKFYEDWYIKYYNNPPINPKMQGYITRKKVHLLKLAMIFSLAHRDDLLLQPEDFGLAMNLLQITEPTIEKALSYTGRNELNLHMRNVLSQINQAKKMNLEELIATNYATLNFQEIQEIIKALEAMGRVKVTQSVEGNKVTTVVEAK